MRKTLDESDEESQIEIDVDDEEVANPLIPSSTRDVDLEDEIGFGLVMMVRGRSTGRRIKRDIVMQYLCLFYGSDNKMYTNNCINQEDVSDSNPVNHKVAPRPPCRSFCVQVAEVCANDPKFMQLCSSIDCPPMEDSCTPDPMIEGQVLAANIGCDMPYSINPYFKPSSAPRAHHGTSAFMTSVIVSLLTASLLLRRN